MMNITPLGYYRLNEVFEKLEKINDSLTNKESGNAIAKTRNELLQQLDAGNLKSVIKDKDSGRIQSIANEYWLSNMYYGVGYTKSREPKFSLNTGIGEYRFDPAPYASEAIYKGAILLKQEQVDTYCATKIKANELPIVSVQSQKQINFTMRGKTDYEYWWNKEGLTEEELITLVFGLNYDEYCSFYEISNKQGRSKEEEQFTQDYYDLINKGLYKDIWTLRDRIAELRQKGYWNGNKQDYILNVYEKGVTTVISSSTGCILDAHPDFWAFLDSIGKKPTHFDKFKNYATYNINFDTWPIENITNEDTAISILLGLEPEYFTRFMHLYNSRTNSKDFSNEEQCFYREYQRFSFTHFLESNNIRMYKSIKKAMCWDGNFQGFVNILYNDGYIFHESVAQYLEKAGIQLIYKQGFWPINLYQGWKEDGLWNFQQAVNLYTGHFPNNSDKYFEDMRSSTLYFRQSLNNQWFFYDTKKARWEDLEVRLKKHVAAGNIEEVEYDNTQCFKPNIIVQWLLDNTLRLPPPALLEALGMPYNIYSKDNGITPVGGLVDRCDGINPLTSEERNKQLLELAIQKLKSFNVGGKMTYSEFYQLLSDKNHEGYKPHYTELLGNIGSKKGGGSNSLKAYINTLKNKPAD